MKRELTNKINYILDNLIPPIIRDNKMFMFPLFWLLFKDKARYFLNFKENVAHMSKEEYCNCYAYLADVHLQRDTDLNAKCINFILNNIEGNKVLDIACGRGFLSKEIAQKNNALKVFGLDIIPPKEISGLHKNLAFMEGSVENIPFDDNFIDTTICAHTLEHTQNINKAISELRRVTRNKLIIVVPKQREYKYTFDLHLNFFPYEFCLLKVMNHKNGTIVTLDGDFIYYESKQS